MAQFLDLVKDLGRESGTLSASTITTVVGATGRAERLVNWVSKAYVSIQNSRSDWNWLFQEKITAITAGTASYTPAALGISERFGRFVADDQFWRLPVSIYKTVDGVAKETPIRQLDYIDWFAKYGRATHAAGQPIEWALSPSGGMVFGPTPDTGYTVRLLYYKAPQVLMANTDVPEMPSQFHELITAEAHRLLLQHDGAYQESVWLQAEVNRIRFELERDQLPAMHLSGYSIR